MDCFWGRAAAEARRKHLVHGLNAEHQSLKALQQRIVQIPRCVSARRRGWPGRGLPLLRLVAGALLVLDGVAGLTGASPRESVILQVIAAIAGVFLLAGLWTPIRFRVSCSMDRRLSAVLNH